MPKYRSWESKRKKYKTNIRSEKNTLVVRLDLDFTSQSEQPNLWDLTGRLCYKTWTYQKKISDISSGNPTRDGILKILRKTKRRVIQILPFRLKAVLIYVVEWNNRIRVCFNSRCVLQLFTVRHNAKMFKIMFLLVIYLSYPRGIIESLITR